MGRKTQLRGSEIWGWGRMLREAFGEGKLLGPCLKDMSVVPKHVCRASWFLSHCSLTGGRSAHVPSTSGL